ncbi:MAG TPA: SGNH/GDSL hydrolase family protein [Ornithinibacter sp.]|nr:SGNH/GDSL hydrolase family protein [Ornithinibacter sp.]
MTRTTLPILAAATALALALSACGGDPEPTVTSAAPSTAPSTAASPSASPSPSGAAGGEKLYVALGDSLAAGYQPGGTELRDTAYPALTANRLGADGAELTVENLGCSGETTTSLLEGGRCDYAEGSQLEQAESLLTSRPGEVGLVTIDIGGNDLLRCVRGGADIDATCVAEGVRTVQRNLPTILERLRAAAGDDVPVLVLGYYNPWVAAQALDQPVKGVDAAAKAYTRLSTAIEDAAEGADTTFVGLDDAFATDDTTPTTIGGRTVPENAARVCTLTNLCTARDIHFSDEGAATVARVLAEAAQKAGVA